MTQELIEQDSNLPVTVFDRDGGPKPIGVLDRPVNELDELGIREQLRVAAEILINTYGPQQFQNELGRQFKKDVVLMERNPGSNIFIATAVVTIAVLNDAVNNSLLIEVRRPAMPYQRGRLTNRKQLGECLGIQSLLEE